MRFILLATGFMILFCTQSVNAQPPDVAWTTVIGSVSPDEGYSVRQTTDGGYIVTGVTVSFGAGSADLYLIKTNSIGDTLWTKTFGGVSIDWGESVNQTTDGGYIITGATQSFGAGSADVYLIKTDANGNTLWTTTIGGADDDEGYSVQQTTDGGYIITGSTQSFGAGSADVYLIKTDASGDTLWTTTIGGVDSDIGGFVQQTTDEGYILTGFTNSYGAGSDDVYLIKTDSSGNTLWTKTYGGADSDHGYYVQQTTDGGYILAGYAESIGAGGNDVYLIKTTSCGSVLWEKTFGGTGNDVGESVQQTTDGGYILTGFTNSYGAGSYDVYLIKTNSSGDTLWTKTIGGAEYDRCNSVQQTTDGGYILGGLTVSYGAGSSDVYLIKLDPETGIEVESGGSPQLTLESICPNPFSSDLSITYSVPEQTRVELAVFDLCGRLIEKLMSDQLPAGSHSAMWIPTQNTPSGCYLVVLDASGHYEVGRCLKLN
ncbi:MAG: hypothetical protein K8S24_09980 [Candidatus Aegiribacteria sp.]|nr:hypothetical protein [Candidatus Aegiribacteria sp.]